MNGFFWGEMRGGGKKKVFLSLFAISFFMFVQPVLTLERWEEKNPCNSKTRETCRHKSAASNFPLFSISTFVHSCISTLRWGRGLWQILMRAWHCAYFLLLCKWRFLSVSIHSFSSKLEHTRCPDQGLISECNLFVSFLLYFLFMELLSWWSVYHTKSELSSGQLNNRFGS